MIKLAEVLEILDKVVKIGEVGSPLKGMYGIIHKQAFINYRGKPGRLVWDYILLNELTFEDSETGEKYSLGMSASDEKIEGIFNDLVERYGA